jgi:hypothetical protein
MKISDGLPFAAVVQTRGADMMDGVGPALGDRCAAAAQLRYFAKQIA